MIEKNKNWMYVSFAALACSVLSLILPVVYYSTGGWNYAYNVFGLMGSSFIDDVMSEYVGSFMYGTDRYTVSFLIVLLCLTGVAAIVCSFVGLKSMSKQYESQWPFRLTLAGILLTALPAMVLLVAVTMSGGWFSGTLSPGAYMFVTPAAMVISCLAVVKRHRLNQDELRIQQAAAQYIRPAGDLPLQ